MCNVSVCSVSMRVRRECMCVQEEEVDTAKIFSSFFSG